jgi:hypothetical protein
MEKVTFTRTELYDLVWKSTFGNITKKYGISGFGIRKACEQMQIPLPDYSHWLSVRYDRPLYIKKLSQDYTGNDIVEILKKKFEIITKVIPEPTPLILLTKEIQKDLKAPLIVPNRLVKPDILVLQTKQYWDRKSKSVSHEDNNDFLPIYVEKSNLDRALRFFDTLIKLLKYRGHCIKKGKYGYGTVALIDGIEIRVHLREATKRVLSTKKHYNYEYVPTGEFVFQIGESFKHHEWRDGKTFLLEDLIPKIVAKLEIDAKKEKEWQEECRISQIKREKEEAIKKVFLECKQKELSNFKQLLSNAERLDKSIKLRNYIKTVEENALINDVLDEELKYWIIWAKDKVDWYDPLIRKQDDLLSDSDFKNLD